MGDRMKAIVTSQPFGDTTKLVASSAPRLVPSDVSSATHDSASSTSVSSRHASDQLADLDGPELRRLGSGLQQEHPSQLRE